MDYFECLSNNMVTDLELSKLEKKINFILPDDYKMFLKSQNGVKIKKGYICSFPIRCCSEKSDVLQGLFGIDSELKNYAIDYWINFYNDEIEKNGTYLMIPIGISAFGSVIFLKKTGKIILADFSLSFKSSFSFKCTYNIANSFSDFINGLSFIK